MSSSVNIDILSSYDDFNSSEYFNASLPVAVPDATLRNYSISAFCSLSLTSYNITSDDNNSLESLYFYLSSLYFYLSCFNSSICLFTDLLSSNILSLKSSPKISLICSFDNP